METNQSNVKTESLPVIEKVNALFQKDKITQEDLCKLNDEEATCLWKKINTGFRELEGVERDRFLKKVEFLLDVGTNDDLWEYNHGRITCAISKLMCKYGHMPGKADLMRETGLSRVTIYKHLAEYKQKPLFTGQEEQYKIIKGTMLANLYDIAMRGDVKAIKLYFEATGVLDPRHSGNKNVIENQHNYIQINETRLSQEEIQKLSPERLKQIEELLKVPEKVEK